MNKTVQLLIVGFAIIFSSCSNDATYKTPETEIQKVSYSLGVNMASMVKAQGIDSIDVNLLAKAFTDFKENQLDISEEESMKTLQDFFSKKQVEKQEANISLMKEWLADTISIQEKTTTESGLKYQIINKGVGEKPTTNNQVTVHYHGMLTDGTVFDSSIERGQPVTFGVTQVIKGWTEALQLMSVGDKWRLTIPSELAYGDQSPTPKISPNSDLIFIVELLSIN
jgi:FKBP-type peptidyl-prolyl cis-trans isomerase FklB